MAKYCRELEKGPNVIDLPHYVSSLCSDAFAWVSPVRHFGAAYAEVIDNECHVTTKTKGWYSVLVFGDRKDETAMKDWNEHGCEYIESDTPPPSPPSSPRNE